MALDKLLVTVGVYLLLILLVWGLSKLLLLTGLPILGWLGRHPFLLGIGLAALYTLFLVYVLILGQQSPKAFRKLLEAGRNLEGHPEELGPPPETWLRWVERSQGLELSKHEEEILRFASSAEHPLREAFLKLVPELSSREAAQLQLRYALEHPKTRLAEKMVLGLAQRGPVSELQSALKPLLSHENKSLRQKTAWGLTRRIVQEGPDGEAATLLDAYQAQIEEHNPDEELLEKLRAATDSQLK